MYAELRGLYSPDIDDLEQYRPANPESFAFLLQAIVGPNGEDGEESFDIEVCTPKWMDQNFGLEDVRTGQHLLIIKEYNYQRIVRFIENYLMHCSGEDWAEVAKKVADMGHWEFENYTELKS